MTLRRFISGVIVLLIVWYLATRVFSLFDSSISRRAAAILSIRSNQDAVQISLQGKEWQRAENGLKIYPGDAISTKNGGDIIITFFDGTRVRPDTGTELALDRSESLGTEGTSKVTMTLKSGRTWINSPMISAFSGAIERTIDAGNFSVHIPSNANILVSGTQIVVVRADGLGASLTLGRSFKSTTPVIIGEGQTATFTDEAARSIASGKDPYDFRDPISTQLFRDPFLQSSYVLFTSSTGSTGAGTIATTDTSNDQGDLTISSPENQQKIEAKTVTVSGRVSDRVALLLINGQPISTKKDLSFSVDLSLPKDPTTTIKIDAQDAQGIPLANIQRTVVNGYKPIVAPVKIKSPVGSGETLTTSLPEIEITGEAPQGTQSILINDYRLQLYKAGNKTWSYLASVALGNLVKGENAYKIVAVDADGNQSPSRSITIVYANAAPTGTGAVAQPPLKQNPPLTPGTLSVDTPNPGGSAETTEKEIVIGGKTSDATTSISVNGYTLSLYVAGKTTWNYIASTDLGTMKRGKNVYRIVARNAAGEILDVLEYVITYKP